MKIITFVHMETHNFATQSIHMDNIANARDLGGYRMKDGRRVRRGLLLRGGSLYLASKRDIQRLEDEFHTKFIFDFRSDGEVKHQPDKELRGAKYMQLPTMDPYNGKRAQEIFKESHNISIEDLVVKSAPLPMTQDYCRTIYTNMVSNEYSQLQYATLLQSIAQLEEGAVYLHCSQGKDRTGLGAALILAALGADRETIIEDFAISDEFYSDLVKQTDSRVNTPEEKKVIRTLLGVSVDYFIDSLDLIDQMYGSMDDYLKEMLVLTDSEIEKLRSRLLI